MRRTAFTKPHWEPKFRINSALSGGILASEYTLPLATVKEWSDFDHMEGFSGCELMAWGIRRARANMELAGALYRTNVCTDCCERRMSPEFRVPGISPKAPDTSCACASEKKIARTTGKDKIVYIFF
jgi:hypothetical protein